MSRIGKLPIKLVNGVNVTVNGNEVVVKGPKGELSREISNDITVEVKDGEVILTRKNDLKETKALHGLYRALINNMVKGVTEGFEKKLYVVGVGYKVAKQGNKLVFNIGYSHPIEFEAPQGITLDVIQLNDLNIKTIDRLAAGVSVKGIDNVLVAQVAANIRCLRLPELYHGYGIRYSTEDIHLKPGKTGK